MTDTAGRLGDFLAETAQTDRRPSRVATLAAPVLLGAATAACVWAGVYFTATPHSTIVPRSTPVRIAQAAQVPAPAPLPAFRTTIPDPEVANPFGALADHRYSFVLPGVAVPAPEQQQAAAKADEPDFTFTPAPPPAEPAPPAEMAASAPPAQPAPQAVPFPPVGGIAAARAHEPYLRPRHERRPVRASVAAAAPPAATPAPATDHRTFFQKLFNLQPSSGSALAYASPEDGVAGSSAISNALTGGRANIAAGADPQTAVYDIAAHKVFLPDGETLEAHSGLGNLLDDPGHVNVKNRGATPPNLYELTLREKLFHGVQALRLNPIGRAPMYGRNGLLAHTFMLGPKGDSNGCISFRDYARFLKAYESGQIRKLLVVARR